MKGDVRYALWRITEFIRGVVRFLRKLIGALVKWPFRILAFLWQKKILQFLIFVTIAYFSVDIGKYFFTPDVSWLAETNPRLTEMMIHMERSPMKSGDAIRIRHSWVTYEEISPYLVEAVLIGEDDKFWEHGGFDVDAIVKAVERDIKERKFKVGGSTITQQLAKNLFLSPSKNPARKLKEAILAWRMERALSKERILEIYLNVAEWGDSVYGAGAASVHYFGKRVKNLEPMEAARLAAALPNPKRYSPVGNSSYINNRSRIIYGVMKKRGLARK
jgi:monofunctional biosynthetic peptidoglycan transglycosylase